MEIVKTPPEQVITAQLARFEQAEIKKDDLVALAKKFEGLTIAGVEDREGYKAVHDARIVLKSQRVQISKVGKELRATANALVKAVIEREDELIDLIQPTEKHLQQMEDAIDEEKEKIRIANDRAEDERIQKMSDELAKVGYGADYTTLKGMTEEQFAACLKENTDAYNKRMAEEEQERVEAQAKREEEDRLRKEQEEKNQQERIRLEKIQAEQDRKAKELQEQQDKIERDRVELQKQKTESRKQRMFDQGFKWDGTKWRYKSMAIEDMTVTETGDPDFNQLVDLWKKRIVEVNEQERKEKEEEEERIRLKAIEDQAENDRIAKEEEEERKAALPDKQKLIDFMAVLSTLEYPDMKSKKFKGVITRLKEEITKVQTAFKATIQ